MEHEMKILGLAGSLRRASFNRALLGAALELAPGDVETEVFASLGALPFYDGDLEGSGNPAVIEDLRRAIARADALLIATPEYNGGTSGVLKNALDWASRGPVRILAGKPVAVMGASPGRNGAQGGIDSVVHTLRRTRSDVLDHVVAVPFAADAFDENLGLVDMRVHDEVALLMAELSDRVRTSIALAA
jgi:chromate reductase, NAD(P)H dehydrogenase (quinone)